MHVRLMGVLFMLAFFLMPGEYAGATTITHDFLFKIDKISTPEGEYTDHPSEGGFKWAKGDTFHLSFSYKKETAYNNSSYQIIAYNPTLSLGLDRTEFGFETISGGGRSVYIKPWPEYAFFILEAVTVQENSCTGSNYFSIESRLGSNVWSGYYHFNEPVLNNAVNNYARIDFSTNPVPEPSTLMLLGAGLAGLIFYRRKRQP